MCDLIFEKDFEQSHSSKTTSVFLCDLIFEKDFVLSHNSSNTSVFVCGYKEKVPMFEYPLHRFNFVKSVYNNLKSFTL